MDDYQSPLHTIKDVAQLLNISTDAIRLYEKEGLVTPIRNEENGYRYYDLGLIEQIMGITLYRQLDISLQEIKQIFKMRSLKQIIPKFQDLIAENEAELKRLTNKIHKMKFMVNHLQTVDASDGIIEIRDLPKLYIPYMVGATVPNYDDMLPLLAGRDYSYGNMGYRMTRDESGTYKPSAIFCAIREPMMELEPWKHRKEFLPCWPGCKCIYSITHKPYDDFKPPTFAPMLEYAKLHQLECLDTAYSFYIFSITDTDGVVDYFENYIPIKE